jgi:hypothetical protein
MASSIILSPQRGDGEDRERVIGVLVQYLQREARAEVVRRPFVEELIW